MGVLTCKLFTKPPNDKLERCALKDADHITPGSVGEHVQRIQVALDLLMDIFLVPDGKYGPKTAAAVVAFKEAQSPPLRQPYQSIADNIVGIRTIKALDQQMFKFENTPPPPDRFVSETDYGAPHNHNLCVPFLDADLGPDGLISHRGTPVNPLHSGRMVCIGGANEVKYLGFENFVPDPKRDPDMLAQWVSGRQLTSSLPDHSVSDICFRSTPIDKFMKTELKRIAMRGCRLTYASNMLTVASLYPFFFSLGPQIQFVAIPNPKHPDPLDNPLVWSLNVVVISMQNIG